MVFKMDVEFSINENRFFNNFSDYFDDDVINALMMLIDCGVVYSQTKQDGYDVRITIDNYLSYEIVLVFKNCQIPHGTENCYFDFSGSTFTKDNDTFIVPAFAENYETDEAIPVVFRFSDISVETNVYNCTQTTLLITEPWSIINLSGMGITEKNETSPTLLNEKEKELLPILKEIHYIETPEVYVESSGHNNFPLLKNLANKYNASKLITLLENLEFKNAKGKRTLFLSNKISFEMNKSCYEPMWREIYNKLTDSQKEYPRKTETCFPKKDLKEIRTKIQNLMESNGYNGTYPDFYKSTDLTGLRLAVSHGVDYTVFQEKNSRLYIKCIEECSSDDNILIQFLTGTALNKKGNNTSDVFSCCFNNRGKLFSNHIIWDSNENDYKSIEEITRIAFKKAELKRLSKVEQEERKKETLVSLQLYFGMGVAFGILFTLLFAVFIFFFVMFTDSFESAVDIIKTAPWGYCLLASGGLFGLAMFIISLFTKSK